MTWQRLLETRDRLPAQPLEEWYGSLLERLGEATPFELAILGGRLAATPGLAFLAGYQARCACSGPPLRAASAPSA